MQENRISMIAIIVEDLNQSQKINELLSENGEYIIGRMGIPYRDRGVSIISVVLDAPQNIVSSLSGKLGMINGVTTKTVTSKS